jgi:hypothetical protein
MSYHRGMIERDLENLCACRKPVYQNFSVYGDPSGGQGLKLYREMAEMSRLKGRGLPADYVEHQGHLMNIAWLGSHSYELSRFDSRKDGNSVRYCATIYITDNMASPGPLGEKSGRMWKGVAWGIEQLFGPPRKQIRGLEVICGSVDCRMASHSAMK